jgi:hypothetical protein
MGDEQSSHNGAVHHRHWLRLAGIINASRIRELDIIGRQHRGWDEVSGYIPQSLEGSQAKMPTRPRPWYRDNRLESIVKVFIRLLFFGESAQQGSELPASLIGGSRFENVFKWVKLRVLVTNFQNTLTCSK